MKLDRVLLLVTLLLAVILSLSTWIIDAIPFDYKTISFLIMNIYIGIAGMLVYQKYSGRNNE